MQNVLSLHNAAKKSLSGHVFQMYFINVPPPFCLHWKCELLLIIKKAGFSPLFINLSLYLSRTDMTIVTLALIFVPHLTISVTGINPNKSVFFLG